MLKKTLTAVLFAMTQASLASAAHPLATDDAGIVEKGKYELETGYSRTFGAGEGTDSRFDGSLKHGITDRMDLGIVIPYRFEPFEGERFESLSVQFKFSLVPETFALSVTNELGSSAYFINGIFSKSFDPVTFHLNLGYLKPEDTVSGAEGVEEESGKGTTAHSAAVEYTAGNMDFVGEITGDVKALGAWQAGARYRLSETATLSAGYGEDFDGEQTRLSFGLNTTF